MTDLLQKLPLQLTACLTISELHQHQPSTLAPNSFEDFVEALPEATHRLIGDVQIFPSNNKESQIHLKQLAYATTVGNLMLVSNGASQNKQGYYRWKIVANIKHTEFQCAIYVDRSGPK